MESDSSYVVGLLSSRSSVVPWNHRNRWLYVLHLLSQMDFLVSHIFREGNKVADMLSKSSFTSMWWSSAPQFVQNLVSQDMSGREQFRFCV